MMSCFSSGMSCKFDLLFIFPLGWMEGLQPQEPKGLFAQRNCLSAPFYGVVKAVWLRVLLNDVWINACSYMQLGSAVQEIIERDSCKLGFYWSVCVWGVLYVWYYAVEICLFVSVFVDVHNDEYACVVIYLKHELLFHSWVFIHY